MTTAGKEIVESILEASKEILHNEGPEGFSTNRIAQRAGVSVGSLYHYFPNKDAIVAELARWLETQSLTLFDEMLQRHVDKPYSAAVREAVRILASNQLGDHRFRAAVRELVPDGWTRRESLDVDARARAKLAEHLRGRKDVRGGDPERLAWIALHAVEGIIEAAVWQQPELLEDEAFLDEVVVLVDRFLAPDPV